MDNYQRVLLIVVAVGVIFLVAFKAWWALLLLIPISIIMAVIYGLLLWAMNNLFPASRV